MSKNIKTIQRDRRRKRVRSKVSGDAQKPRVSVFRSNRYITVQAIDDNEGKTLAFAWSKKWPDLSPKDSSFEAGKEIAKSLLEKGILKAVFDRGGYIYTGNISKVADGLREGGLKI